MFLFSSFILIYGSNLILAEYNLDIENWLSYNVISASDTINVFYGNFPPGTYFGEWSVTKGDKIIYNITSVNNFEINGTLFLGNESSNKTFTNVRNIDIAFGLTLGIYPWNGGFFADSSNWNNIQNLVQGTNTTIREIKKYAQEIQEELKYFSVIMFNTSNYYGQYSLLYYHRTSGVLIKASTSYNLYALNISLTSTNLVLETQTADIDLSFLFSILFCLLSIRLYRRKKLVI